MRGFAKNSVPLLAIAVVGVGILLFLAGCGVKVEPRAISLAADGREHRAAVLHGHPWSGVDTQEAQVIGDLSGTRLQQSGRKVELWIRTPVQPGKYPLRVRYGGQTSTLLIHAEPDNQGDAAGDGLPDWMPLHDAQDRQAFRAWFTELAERGAASDKLPPEIIDCASLLRYAYREALVRHDDKWYAQFAAEQMPPLESVQQWSYPHTPLGAGLFRTRRGEYSPGQAGDGTFSQFADAKTLMTANAFLVSRKIGDGRPGDLIFYRQLEQNSEYHSMILTGERGEWVVYHTGPIGTGKGEMRRMLVADLLRHPDARWRPEPENSNFLGVYRWNILREGD